MSRRWPFYLLGPVLAVLVWSGIAPYERLTWFLEVFPAIAGLGVMAWTWRRFPLTQLVSTLIAIHIVILCIGGRYTYALVPIGDWVRDWLGLSRNHYDRLGHFAQGFVPAMIAREIFIRHKVIAKRGWMPFLVTCFCLALSAVYELIEWCSALMLGQGADSFLGTQGDVWDTQTDMFLAGVGATCALLTISRWHDRQLARLVAT